MDPTWARGADCSHWHPIIDASALRQTVDFVGIKVSEGTANVDPTFSANLSLARAAGFDLVILYHLARPGDGAAQASRLLSLVGNLRDNERIAVDTERTSNVGLPFLRAFFGELPRDRSPILYTSAAVWAAMSNPAFPEAAGIDLWLPRYGNHEPLPPDPWFQIGHGWTFWQTSEAADIPGIDGPCDSDVFRGTPDDLRAYAAQRFAP